MISIVVDDLTIVKRWCQVEVMENDKGHKYVKGKIRPTDATTQVILPMLAHGTVTFAELQSLVQDIGQTITGVQQHITESSLDGPDSSFPSWSLPPLAITLAVVASDSSLSYYRISSGLLPSSNS